MSVTKRTHSDIATNPILKLKKVSKHFGSFVAVDNLDLAIEKGEIFGFLGPNGAGKSTTIRMILDASRPTSGNISLFGRSNRLTKTTHQRIGYLSGDMVIDEDLSGRQYLDFVQSLYKGDQKEFTLFRTHLVHELELNADIKISRYSRGNKLKVGLVAALMHNPELLILDEPSSGLDPLMQEVFIKLLKDYRRDGGTVFMSSHSLDEVQKLCDRVAFIRTGKLAGVANIDDLNKSAVKKVRLAARPEVLSNLGRKVSALQGMTAAARSGNTVDFTYMGDVQSLLRILALYPLENLTIREPDLDEIFMTYYENPDQPPEENT